MPMPTSTDPTVPLTPKTVKFNTAELSSSSTDSAGDSPDRSTKVSSASLASNNGQPAFKRRRSSMKESSIITPILKEHYQHPDPLLRRLRLRTAKQEPVNLCRHFKDVKVVAFLFG